MNKIMGEMVVKSEIDREFREFVNVGPSWVARGILDPLLLCLKDGNKPVLGYVAGRQTLRACKPFS